MDLSRIDVRALELLIEDLASEAWCSYSRSEFMDELRAVLHQRRDELEKVVQGG